VKEGAEQLFAWELKLSPQASRMRQLVHGLWLPVVVIRAVLADRQARRRWLKTSGAQAAVTVLLAVLFVAVCRPTGSGSQELPEDANEAAVMEMEAVRDAVDDRAAQLVERARNEAEARMVEAEAQAIDARLRASREALEERLRTGQATPEEELRALVQGALEEAELARQAAVRAQEQVARARAEAEQLRQKLREQIRASLEEAAEAGEATVPDAVRQLRRAAQQARGEQAALAAAAGLGPAQIRDELRSTAARAVARAESRLAELRSSADRFVALALPVRLLLFLAAVWSALYAVQFIVITLSRDFHDMVSRDACLLTGIEPEDPELVPRVRLNWSWTRKRIRRRWRALKLLLFGVPLIWPISIALPGDSTLNVLLFLWGAYWLVVFAAAKSARAWVDEGLAPPPWFIRGWTWLTTRVVFFRWGLPRAFGRLWERHAREMNAPAECVEQQPWPFIGLMVFRSISMVPILKLFLRPFIPVASAHLLEAYRERFPARAQRPASAVAVAVLEAAPAPSPAAEPAPAAGATGS
jgi:hypothetical protein